MGSLSEAVWQGEVWRLLGFGLTINVTVSPVSWFSLPRALGARTTS